jgi:L-rhamnose mutarotase
MFTVGQTFKLKPGYYNEYRKAHDELWPELAATMSASQVSMVVYHHQGRLFLFATAPSREHLERSYQGPVAQRWAEYMATMLETDPQGRSIVEELEQAFAFGGFADGEAA